MRVPKKRDQREWASRIKRRFRLFSGVLEETTRRRCGVLAEMPVMDGSLRTQRLQNSVMIKGVKLA